MIMKKQYISPEAEVFVCKINSMPMASDNLGAPDSIEEIIPSSDAPGTGEDNVFNAREFDW